MAPDSFWSNILKSEKKSDDPAAILRLTPIFSDLKEREILEISQICHARSYEKGEVIFQEGEFGAGMYVVVEGAVRISTQSLDAQEIELAKMGKGDFFGEIALLDEGPRSATATAIERTRTIGLFKPDLFDLIDRNPPLGVRIVLKVSQVLAARLRHTNELLKKMQNKELPVANSP